MEGDDEHVDELDAAEAVDDEVALEQGCSGHGRSVTPRRASGGLWLDLRWIWFLQVLVLPGTPIATSAFPQRLKPHS